MPAKKSASRKSGPPFHLLFTAEAGAQLDALESDVALKKRLKAVNKALGWLQVNPRHPGLNTHKYSSKTGPNGEPVLEAYAENKTPGAYRVFFCYGPEG
ncbi:MAG: Uncharacterized protein JWO82_1762, partial [Akkermansiaceae bacterium]|nr:Uncharacterized protein [Akkermansiaceae bacterium]